MSPSGEWQFTADGQSYKFKMDSNDYPDGLGNTAAWKSIDASTWQTTLKLNGKTLSTDTLRLGTDGILTVSTKGTKPNGEAINDTITLQRVSGGPGKVEDQEREIQFTRSGGIRRDRRQWPFLQGTRDRHGVQRKNSTVRTTPARDRPFRRVGPWR
jgi:hypothetical protein